MILAVGSLMYLAYTKVPWDEVLSEWAKNEYTGLTTAVAVLVIALEIVLILNSQAIWEASMNLIVEGFNWFLANWVYIY